MDGTTAAISIFGVLVGLLVLALAALRITTRPLDIGDVYRGLTDVSNGQRQPSGPYIPGEASPLTYLVAALGNLPVPERILTPFLPRLGELLAQSGNPGGIAPTQYVRMKVALGLLCAGLFTFIAVIGLVPLQAGIGLALGSMVSSWLLPDWYVRQLARLRVDDINRSVPDVLDLLVVSVDAGLSLEVALRRVAARFPDPLGQELRRAVQELDAGARLGDALRHIGERTGADELRRFIGPFLQAQLLGVRITEQLRIQAEDMRTRRQQRAQEAGRAAATAVLAPMMLCIFPSLLITIVGPALLHFFQMLTAH